MPTRRDVTQRYGDALRVREEKEREATRRVNWAPAITKSKETFSESQLARTYVVISVKALSMHAAARERGVQVTM